MHPQCRWFVQGIADVQSTCGVEGGERIIMPRYKAFVTASRRTREVSGGLRQAERKVFHCEVEAPSLREAQRTVRQQFVQEHSSADDDWLPEQVEVIPLDESS